MSFFTSTLVLLTLATILLNTSASQALPPDFAGPIPNVTTAVSRDAVLECFVENLGMYKVAWIKMDTQTLLTIDMNVITRDPRIKVSNNNMRQWFLHIKKVKEEDRGYYMCQINTEPMISITGYLDVMVPPIIIEDGTSSDTIADEMSKVSLRCQATGYPTPKIFWRREDQKDISVVSYTGRRFSVSKVEGEYLNISQITREEMGAYLCIATNGIPPSVSKRIMLEVNFRPKIRVPNQLVGANVGSQVILKCNVQAWPRPLTSWVRHKGVIIINSNMYHLIEENDSYNTYMSLKIKHLSEADFGSYKCVARNSFGEKEGFIRLYEEILSTTKPYMLRSTFMAPIPFPEEPHIDDNDSTLTPRLRYGNPTSNSLMDDYKDLRAEHTRFENSQKNQNGRTKERSLHRSKSNNTSCATRFHLQTSTVQWLSFIVNAVLVQVCC
ncbi:lachesin-like isoform X2 [Tachypleus tridentatus]|uniref:lachesin-like isoform X2 n=1 Tax=Tachypleus tridentatus TaxID=6853 RepID=UPI003FD4D16E